MATVQDLVADPEFQQLNPADKRALLSEFDPEFGSLNDADIQSFSSSATSDPTSPDGIPSIEVPAAPLNLQDYLVTQLGGGASASGVQALFDNRQDIANFARETLPYVGLTVGGVLGTPADVVSGPAGTLAGAGLGYAGGKSLADVIASAIGADPSVQLTGDIPVDIGTLALGAGEAFNEGVGTEMGGRLVGAAIAPIGRQVSRLSDVIRESANKKASEALLRGGGTAAQKAATERLVPEILKRPVGETFAVTGKGLEDKAAVAKEAAGEAIEAFGKLKGEANPQQVVQALEKLKGPHIVEGKSINDEAIGRIEKVQDLLNQYGDSISIEGLRSIRRGFDSEVAKSKGFFKTLDEGSLLDLKKTASNEIRSILGQAEPDLAKLNKQYNFWSNLEDVVSATNTRKAGQTGLAPLLATSGAVLTGGTAGGMAAKAVTISLVNSAIQSPGWKLASARVRSNLADAIGSGDSQAIAKAVEAITKLGISGSNTENASLEDTLTRAQSPQ